jgi:hypothetical protein
MALEVVGRTILRGVVSFLVASFAAIGFAVAYAVGYLVLLQPVDGPIYSGWIAGITLFIVGFAAPFYITWKLLPATRQSR